jgi:aspartate kinase
MNIVVLKFGGTSLSTLQRRKLALRKIENTIKSGCFPVVVVSAIGRRGDPYATDTLIHFVKSKYGEINNRDLDLLLSCGEIISSVFLSDMLNQIGHKSAALTGWQAGIITNSNFGNAEIIRVETKYIMNCIESNTIPVVAGFQGMNESGEITTLGRGGSDITASIIGEALNASAVEIYTDVDGVMTADPKVSKDAEIISRISYLEMYHMAEHGAKVLHPASVRIAARCEIPLYVKNTLSDSPGTLITD